MTDVQLLTHVEEICKSLIYHGRHFSEKRDAIVIIKSINRLADIIEEWSHGSSSKI